MIWLAAFAWTLALEQPVYVLALRARTLRWWEPSAWTLAVNLATHPLLWAILSRFDGGRSGVIAAELVVALVEGTLVSLLLARGATPKRDAALVGFGSAFAANLFSWLAGGWLFSRLLPPF